MTGKWRIEFLVGLFILLGVVAVMVLALKVSGLGSYSRADTFRIMAIFDNVGDLKVRAPITIAGVRVGEVTSVTIDGETFKAQVKLLIDKKQDKLPADTSAKILTAGVIGANYVELIPGYSENNLKDGDVIVDTQPAIILENLVGQLLYSLGEK